MRAFHCVDGNLGAAERAGLFRFGLGFLGLFVYELRFRRCHELYDEEDGERDYQKIEDGLDEVAVVERGISGLGRERGGCVLRGVEALVAAEDKEHILEAAAACRKSDERHDEVGDE